MDVHKETIAVAIAEKHGTPRYYGEIANTSEVITRLIKTVVPNGGRAAFYGKHRVRLAFMQIVEYNVAGWHGNRAYNLRELFTISSSEVIKNRIYSWTMPTTIGILKD